MPADSARFAYQWPHDRVATSPPALIEGIADLVLAVDRDGVVRRLTVGRRALLRDLLGIDSWLGRPWVDTVLEASRPAVADLLAGPPILGASAHAFSGSRHVDHPARHGGTVPVLYAAAPIPGSETLVAVGRDVRALDFTDLLLTHGDAPALSYARALPAGGGAGDALCEDLLAPAARRLGSLWEEDLVGFADVIRGVGCLHRLLAASMEGDEPGPDTLARSGRVLLLPAPAETHVFGLAVVGASFRGAGWDVLSLAGCLEEDELATLARKRSFDVIGFSASTDAAVARLAAVIAAVRRAERHRRVRVLVGGRPFVANPDLAGQIGADATARDGRSAVMQANRFLAAAGTARRRPKVTA